MNQEDLEKATAAVNSLAESMRAVADAASTAMQPLFHALQQLWESMPLWYREQVEKKARHKARYDRMMARQLKGKR